MCQAKLEEYCMVIDDQKLDYLAYADDLVLIAKNSKDLQKMLDNFAEEAKKCSDAGVKQGDCLSPRLFTILVQYVMCQAKLEEYCMVIDDQKLDYLAYADDLVLIAKTSKDLQKMLDNFAEKAKKVNLALNLSKCKMMSQTTRKGLLSTCKVEIFKTPLEEVETYEYLG
uniref:Reverse transcriptase domain-containing protein n=1 Tax=Rhabditophanes sp. KR3021 TaxID=114890 RepID=A0AC35THY3_9BILA